MDWLDILLHVLNFLAPAGALALLLPLAGRLVFGPVRGVPVWWAQAAVNFAAGALTLTACLWVFGRDGKMAAYGALVLAVASSQWLLLRGWRRP